MADLWKKAWLHYNRGCHCKGCRWYGFARKGGSYESGFVRSRLKAETRKEING